MQLILKQIVGENPFIKSVLNVNNVIHITGLNNAGVDTVLITY